MPNRFPVGTVERTQTPLVSKGKVHHLHEAAVAECVFMDTFKTDDKTHRCGQAFVDHKSRYGAVFPIKSRRQVAEAFLQFCAGCFTPLILIQDNISENTGKDMKAACRSVTCQSGFSTPCTQQQDFAEGFIGTTHRLTSGFHESKKGKWVRENVFQNVALKHAMKEWLRVNQHTVIQSAKDPEERKHLVAQHAADYLNGLLDEHPRFKVAAAHAASTPMKVGVMRVYLKKHLEMEWKPNEKGTANATHDRDDAVGQRNGYIFDNRDRELQNLVWHHESLHSLKMRMPHLHDLAVTSQGADDGTGKLAKKSGDAPSNELLHNVHCCLEGEKKMVELHVDLLTVKERMRLHPWWGDGTSKRVDLTKNLRAPGTRIVVVPFSRKSKTKRQFFFKSPPFKQILTGCPQQAQVIPHAPCLTMRKTTPPFSDWPLLKCVTVR
jgi:hypothetical protein